MNAMYRIIDFQIESLLPECKKLESNRVSRPEYFLILKVYSAFDQYHFLQKLKGSSIHFSQYEYKKLLTSIDLRPFGTAITKTRCLPTGLSIFNH